MTLAEAIKQAKAARAAHMPCFQIQQLMRAAGVPSDIEEQAINEAFGWEPRPPKTVQQQTIELAQQAALRRLADNLLKKG